MKLELALSTYATKADLKNAAGVNTSKLANKIDLARLKSNVDKLDINKLKSVPNNLINLKSEVDKSVLVPVDLSKLSNVVRNDVIKRYVYNAKIRNIEDKIPDITTLATNTTLNAKINEAKNRKPNISNLTTTTALTAVENKIPNVRFLVKKTDYSTKISEVKIKLRLIMIMINVFLYYYSRI